MNYLKDAIDFAMTLKPVKDEIILRNQNKFTAIGINARFVKQHPVNSKIFFVQINFDYYKKDSNVQEDFYVVLQWNGGQYVLHDGKNVAELDGNEY